MDKPMTTDELREKYGAIDYNNAEELIRMMIKEFQDDFNGLGHANIIIAGKTGVGKSTLINAAFRERLAATGMGEPVTKSLKCIEKKGVPIRIYDTVGLELDEARKKQSIDEIRDLVEEKLQAGQPDEFIHCLWYCIQSDSDRFEAAEQEFVRTMATECELPVFLVITKAYLKKHARDFRTEIQKFNLPVKKICLVLAEAYADDDFRMAPYGVDDLVQVTLEALPDSARRAWANAQRASLVLKRVAAEAIIKQTVTMAFGAGYNPLPMSDAAILAPIQASMFIRITNVYGITLTKSLAASIASSFLGIAGATVVGRTLVANLLKMIPGVGTVVGGTISGGTAAALTWAMGRAYIVLMEKLFNGELTVEDLENESTREKITRLLKDELAKHRGEK